MMTRRELLKTAGAAGVAAWMAPLASCAGNQQQKVDTGTTFKYCLNTSTIEGQDLTLHEYIDVAGEAGYDAIELWVEDVRKYLEEGNSAEKLKRHIENNGLTVENAIGFATWLAPGEEGKKNGFSQMEKDMEMMGQIGCKRIAAPPAG
ncbi:MAG: TIM barrel protein, partial [bacterium]